PYTAYRLSFQAKQISGTGRVTITQYDKENNRVGTVETIFIPTHSNWDYYQYTISPTSGDYSLHHETAQIAIGLAPALAGNLPTGENYIDELFLTKASRVLNGDAEQGSMAGWVISGTSDGFVGVVSPLLGA